MDWQKGFPVWVVFPHQLFESLPEGIVNIAIVEEALFFTQFDFHKQKLVIHRASMQYYRMHLESLGKAVRYYESKGKALYIADLISDWSAEGINEIQMYRPEDEWISQQIDGVLTNSSKNSWGAQSDSKITANQIPNIRLEYIETPQFILNQEEIKSYFQGKTHYLQANFYSAQRKRLDILMEAGKPRGGKWSFDEDNRLRFPKGGKPPVLTQEMSRPDEAMRTEAKKYVAKFFPKAPGDFDGSFVYAVSHIGAKKWLSEFLEKRFYAFGRYEDAMVSDAPLLHHSLLSVYINNGLLLPSEVLQAALVEGEKQSLGLNEIEGFVRQLLGWREFIRGVYLAAGQKQRSLNYWGYNRKIPHSFYTGDTGIGPVDAVIKKVLRDGYCHHIERLMVLSNFMLLCDFDPDEVYRWFMELFVDAYDWVMVPNVYGMGQFADGGMMSSKPYISGSNYLLKMSDFEKGEWTEIWDGLYWRFIHIHRDFFLKNPRMGIMVNAYEKMADDKKERLKIAAEGFLSGL